MGQPHFIVFANEKGGTGKSTTAVHTAIALAASGHRVAALDLDSRQRTMTRYLENRDATVRRLYPANNKNNALAGMNQYIWKKNNIRPPARP